MWQINNRDCNKKLTVSDSTCKKRSNCKWKKLTVTTSACKSLQALILTVNFSICNPPFPFTVDLFCLQSTFFTGAGSYSRLFPFTVNLFHLQSTFSVYSRPFLQVLVVTVDFFHLQSTFSYRRCQLQSTFCYSLCCSSATFCTMYHNTDKLGVGN